MKISNVLAVLVVSVVIAATGYVAYRELLPRKQCDICGRGLHAGHESTILMKNGKELQACCPRCALHRERFSSGQVAGILVMDRASGRQIPAQRAVYVEGSDEVSCIPPSATPPREPGVEYKTVYDRCVPSLAAFSDEGTARDFVASHGGRVLSYAQVVDSVRER